MFSSKNGPPAGSRAPAWLGAALLAAASGILVHQLFVRPIVGLADNSDFARITEPLGLAVANAPPAERFFLYVWPRYRVEPEPQRASGSSEILLARAARVIAAPFSRAGTFDLRWIGAVHAALLLGAAVVLWKESAGLPPIARAAGFGFAVLAFTDVGYVAPLNSFYTQAGSLVFFFWTVAAGVAAARRPGSAVALTAYAAAAALFVSSKPQEALQAVPLAAFGVFLAFRGPRSVRIAAFVLAGGLLAVGGVVAARTRGGLREGALYKMVFFELLPDSPDPAADLRALGLPPGDVRFAGTTNYSADSPYWNAAVRSRIFSSLSYPALLRFYAIHPARAAREATRDAAAGWELPAGFGNFEKSAGFAPGARCAAYSAWTRVRRRALPAAAVLLAVLFGGNALLAAFGPLPATARAGIVALLASGIIAWGVCTLASAHIELVRKLYVFHAITDLLIAADLTTAAASAVSRRR